MTYLKRANLRVRPPPLEMLLLILYLNLGVNGTRLGTFSGPWNLRRFGRSIVIANVILLLNHTHGSF